MEDIIYDDLQGNLMTESDVWSWVVLGDYEGWAFDEIVGGSDGFIKMLVYRKLKSRHEELIKRMNNEQKTICSKI